MLPSPIPVKGRRVADLQQFINIKKEGDFVLLVAYIVAALRDRGPYPILALRGEEGTGKPTLVRLIRSLVDPNKVPLRTLPREERDLYIAAGNGYLLAFDNVSTLPPWLSDGAGLPPGAAMRLGRSIPTTTRYLSIRLALHCSTESKTL